jgi:hypothetical protein
MPVQYTITEVQGIFDLNNKVSWLLLLGSGALPLQATAQ